MGVLQWVNLAFDDYFEWTNPFTSGAPTKFRCDIEPPGTQLCTNNASAMMNLTKTIFSSLAIAVLSSGVALADDFEGGANPNGWTFGVWTPDVMEPSGGNPGGWLHNPGVDSFAPILTSPSSGAGGFHGDYRAMGVTGISIDARTDAAAFGAGGRNFSMVLRDTKGTLSQADDDYAYYVGSLVPQPGQGWVHYNFPIPSASTDAVPSGWKGGWAGDLENFRPGVDWNDVIQNVDRVEFWWLDPAFVALFQQWDVGVDNITLQTGALTPFCAPAANNSTGFPCWLTGSFGTGVGSDLHLDVIQGPPTQLVYLLVGNMATAGIPVSNGLFCLAGPPGAQFFRYNLSGTVMNSVGIFNSAEVMVNMAGTSTVGTGFDVPSSIPTTVPTTITAGDTWHFQAWYRDTPGRPGSSFSNGLSVTF